MTRTLLIEINARARRIAHPGAMAHDPAQQTQDLIERLRANGHHAAADHLAHQLSVHTVERALLFALRETCETVLTAIEAIDPATETLIEQLRVEVEKRLRAADEAKP